MMDMDPTLLMLSFFFGLVGMGMFAYGKKSGRGVPMGVGAALMVFPYFITNAILLLIIGCGLSVAPWFFRNS
jgi:hypothetical protein